MDWLIDGLFLDCKTVRIFAKSSTREQSNLKRGWKLRARLEKYGRVRLARLVRVRVKLNRFWEKNWLFCSLDFFLPMSHTCFTHLRLRLAHALEQALPGLAGCTVAPGTPGDLARRLLMTHACALRLRACLNGVGDPVWWGWFLLFSRSGGHKTKEACPTWPGSPTPCKHGLKSTWRQRYKVILKVTLFLYLLPEVYLTDISAAYIDEFCPNFLLNS